MIEYIFLGIILLAVLLGIGIILTSHKRKFSEKDQKAFREHWQQIISKQADDPQHAIMNADKLIDKVLGMKGYQGSLGKKLKAAKSLFSDNDGLWSAHKLRNKIAHELNFHPKPKETHHAISSFKRALHDLGVKI